jgi:hypothetical protein
MLITDQVAIAPCTDPIQDDSSNCFESPVSYLWKILALTVKHIIDGISQTTFRPQ